MKDLIGKITYPRRGSCLQVEYSRMTTDGTENELTFRLINKGTQTVNSYRAEVFYIEDGIRRSKTVQRIALLLESGATSEEHSVFLPPTVEDGEICLSSVLYDDLSENENAVSVPFATFDVICSMAADLLASPDLSPEELLARAAERDAENAPAPEQVGSKSCLEFEEEEELEEEDDREEEEDWEEEEALAAEETQNEVAETLPQSRAPLLLAILSALCASPLFLAILSDLL